ncbi:MAG: ABC transporter ATP-binding protein [Paracoccus sp. (in: a-proteobacteria)]
MDVTGPAIACQSITLLYPGQTRPVLDNLSFGLRKGGMLTVLGPNGAGKSTLVRVIAGLQRPNGGSARIAGLDLFSLTPARRARHLALVSQSETASFALTVEEVVLTGRAVALGLFGRPGPADRRLAHDALEMMGIADLAGRPLNALSGGQRQLVRIARALVQQSEVLIFDEPTAHLDLANQMLVLEAILQLLADGHTIVSTSHDPAHAMICGGEAMLLYSGSRIEIGPVDKLLTADRLTALYGVPLTRHDGPDRVTLAPDYGSLVSRRRKDSAGMSEAADTPGLAGSG